MNNQKIPPIIALIGALCIGLGAYMLFNSSTNSSFSTINSSSTPTLKTQTTNPLDLSEDYGIVKETVFHKKKLIAFSTPAEFFNYSGKTSWNGLIFDRMQQLPTGLHFVDGRPLSAADYKRAMGGK